MSCKFDKEIVQKYIDNQIDPLEMIFLKEHLRYCSDCQKDVEMLTIADQKLFDISNNIEMPFNLDIFTERIVDQCIEESFKGNKLRSIAHKSYVVSKSVTQNASRFASYIPGTKLVKKGVSASADFLGSSAKSFIKGRLKKAFGNIV